MKIKAQVALNMYEQMGKEFTVAMVMLGAPPYISERRYEDRPGQHKKEVLRAAKALYDWADALIGSVEQND